MTAVSIAQPDITLQLDLEGVIRDAAVSDALFEDGLEAWIGRPWVDTVADLGSDKVRRLVEDARERRVSGFRQVNQRFPSGREVLIEYTAVSLGDRAGLIAIGRSLLAVTEMQSRLVHAQQEMERDYWKLRELETRYRLLFDASNEAVLLVQAANLRIVEANPAALRALGLAPYPPGVIAGQEFLPSLAAPDKTALQAMLERVRVHQRTPGILVRLGRERTPWLVRASLTQSETGQMFLIQLTPGLGAQPGTARADPLPAGELIDRLPEGFVVCDGAGLIVQGNRVFLDLIQVDAAEAALGQPLARWIGQPGAQPADLIAAVKTHGAVRGFLTALRGEKGAQARLELSAACNANDDPQYVGVLARTVSGAEESDRSG